MKSHDVDITRVGCTCAFSLQHRLPQLFVVDITKLWRQSFNCLSILYILLVLWKICSLFLS